MNSDGKELWLVLNSKAFPLAPPIAFNSWLFFFSRLCYGHSQIVHFAVQQNNLRHLIRSLKTVFRAQLWHFTRFPKINDDRFGFPSQVYYFHLGAKQWDEYVFIPLKKLLKFFRSPSNYAVNVFGKCFFFSKTFTIEAFVRYNCIKAKMRWSEFFRNLRNYSWDSIRCRVEKTWFTEKMKVWIVASFGIHYQATKNLPIFPWKWSSHLLLLKCFLYASFNSDSSKRRYRYEKCKIWRL